MTYGRIVVYYLPQKEDPYITRPTVGVNLINKPGEVETPVAYMLTSKLLFNGLQLTTYANFMVIDIKIFYPSTPMDRYYYIGLPINIIPQEINNEYQLMNKLKMDSSCVKSNN